MCVVIKQQTSLSKIEHIQNTIKSWLIDGFSYKSKSNHSICFACRSPIIDLTCVLYDCKIFNYFVYLKTLQIQTLELNIKPNIWISSTLNHWDESLQTFDSHLKLKLTSKVCKLESVDCTLLKLTFDWSIGLLFAFRVQIQSKWNEMNFFQWMCCVTKQVIVKH